MNQVALVGRITKDPELRQLSEGRVQTSFIIAINRNFKNANGEVDTDFVSCSVWGKLATNVVKYCGKGSLIGVGGRLQTRFYDREDGRRVYVVQVVAEEVRFLALKEREDKTFQKQTDQSVQTNDPNRPQTVSKQAKKVSEIPAGFELPKEEAEGLPLV